MVCPSPMPMRSSGLSADNTTNGISLKKASEIACENKKVSFSQAITELPKCTNFDTFLAKKTSFVRRFLTYLEINFNTPLLLYTEIKGNKKHTIKKSGENVPFRSPLYEELNKTVIFPKSTNNAQINFVTVITIILHFEISNSLHKQKMKIRNALSFPMYDR